MANGITSNVSSIARAVVDIGNAQFATDSQLSSLVHNNKVLVNKIIGNAQLPLTVNSGY